MFHQPIVCGCVVPPLKMEKKHQTWVNYPNAPVNTYQREKLGTLGRVPEIYTNIYHLYMDYILVVEGNLGQYFSLGKLDESRS